MGYPLKDLTGRRFNRLYVVSRAEDRILSPRPGKLTPRRQVYWNCLCDCGELTPVSSDNLRSGQVECRRCRQCEHPAALKHGHAHGKQSPTYRAWAHMVSRCTNPNVERYARYGGAGITVCERWMTFENFLQDMGERPESGYSLGRYCDLTNYEPKGCCWMTQAEQNLARRNHNALLKFAAAA
jgi:hypothetical protein